MVLLQFHLLLEITPCKHNPNRNNVNLLVSQQKL